MKHASLALIAILASLGGCTTLGPMPATTGMSAVPIGRPGVELQAGVVPTFDLSQAATIVGGGDATGQLAALFEPDRLLGIPGLVVGIRTFGHDLDRLTEPFIGYRRALDEAGVVSLAAIAYGTRAAASNDGANYQATRVGGEASVDARLIDFTDWLSVHVQGTASVTAISATGHYCVDASGEGADCTSDTPTVDAALSGAFPAATATISLDLRPHDSVFQSARLAFLFTAGSMPTLVNGEQQAARSYDAGGVSLTLGFGADR